MLSCAGKGDPSGPELELVLESDSAASYAWTSGMLKACVGPGCADSPTETSGKIGMVSVDVGPATRLSLAALLVIKSNVSGWAVRLRNVSRPGASAAAPGFVSSVSRPRSSLTARSMVSANSTFRRA